MEHIPNIENVLLKEVDNPNNVYLYLEGDAWCAYERSAYYLAAIKSVAVMKEVIREGYDIIILKAKLYIDEMSLPLSPGVHLKLVADDKLQFSMNTGVDGFLEWKNKQLEKLSA